MPTLSIGNCRQLSTRILNLMHEFRHEVFVKRLKWSLPAVLGLAAASGLLLRSFG